MTYWDVKSLYKKAKIKRKFAAIRLGRPKLESQPVQFADLRFLQRKVEKLHDEGYLILKGDECCFSVNSYQKGRFYSLPKQPVLNKSRFLPQRPMACIGFIGP